MKIWIVHDRFGETYYMLGVFSSEEEAIECCDFIEEETSSGIVPLIAGPYETGKMEVILDIAGDFHRLNPRENIEEKLKLIKELWNKQE